MCCGISSSAKDAAPSRERSPGACLERRFQHRASERGAVRFVTGHGTGILPYTGPHTGQRGLEGRASDLHQIAFGHQEPVDALGPLLKWASVNGRRELTH